MIRYHFNDGVSYTNVTITPLEIKKNKLSPKQIDWFLEKFEQVAYSLQLEKFNRSANKKK